MTTPPVLPEASEAATVAFIEAMSGGLVSPSARLAAVASLRGQCAMPMQRALHAAAPFLRDHWAAELAAAIRKDWEQASWIADMIEAGQI